MAETINEQLLKKINEYTRRELTADEAYAFSVVLCDNEVDRDNERFSVSSLFSLAKLFVGKTGIFDHNPKGSNQTARIIDTEVLTDSAKKTSTGEAYTYLKATAYMVRTDANADLIKEIDGGIKKEVSVSCTVSQRICSVCRANLSEKACSHKKGRVYNGVKCYTILENPTDAYEWSFVAVPAQVNAGVTKRYGGDYLGEGEVIIKASELELLKKKASDSETLSQEFRDETIREVIRLSFLCHPEVAVKTVVRIAEGMSMSELIDMKCSLSKAVKNVEKAQLFKAEDKSLSDNKKFKV